MRVVLNYFTSKRTSSPKSYFRQTLANTMFIFSGTCCHAIIPLHALYTCKHVQISIDTICIFWVCVYILIFSDVHCLACQLKCFDLNRPFAKTLAKQNPFAMSENNFSRGYSLHTQSLTQRKPLSWYSPVHLAQTANET